MISKFGQISGLDACPDSRYLAKYRAVYRITGRMPDRIPNIRPDTDISISDRILDTKRPDIRSNFCFFTWKTLNKRYVSSRASLGLLGIRIQQRFHISRILLQTCFSQNANLIRVFFFWSISNERLSMDYNRGEQFVL